MTNSVNDLPGFASVKTHHIILFIPKGELSGTSSASRPATIEGNIRKMRFFFPILHRPSAGTMNRPPSPSSERYAMYFPSGDQSGCQL